MTEIFAATVAALVLLWGSVLPAHAAGDRAEFSLEAPTGTTALWVDVEAPGLTSADVVVQVQGPSASREDAVMATSAFGATAVVAAAPGVWTVEVVVSRAANADVALTFVDPRGRITKEGHERVSFTGSSDSDKSKRPGLPSTGAEVADTTAAALILGGLVMVALWVRMSRKGQRNA
ncbi:MAG: hypothetical protein R2722_16120 [Tessaracoccus sp.]